MREGRHPHDYRRALRAIEAHARVLIEVGGLVVERLDGERADHASGIGEEVTADPMEEVGERFAYRFIPLVASACLVRKYSSMKAPRKPVTNVSAASESVGSPSFELRKAGFGAPETASGFGAGAAPVRRRSASPR